MTVEVFEQKRFHHLHLLRHRLTESHQRAREARFVGTLRLVLRQMLARGVDHIVDLIAQHPSDGFIKQAPGFAGVRQAWMLLQGDGFVMRKQRHLVHLRQREQTRAHAIVDVVRVVGNGIGQVAQLCFQTGLRAIQEAMGHATRLLRFDQQGIAFGAVFQNAFARFKTEVQAIEFGIALFQMVHHPQTLQVVFKAAIGLHAFVQCVLSCMAKRGVTQIMRQRNSLYQILVQTQGPRNGASQLRHFQGMR